MIPAAAMPRRLQTLIVNVDKLTDTTRVDKFNTLKHLPTRIV